MKIGKETVPRSSISTSDEHTIVVRGHDLSKELIGKISFVDHFFLLLTGKMPSPVQTAVLNATLVAIAEHGLVPSVQAARMTFAAAPDAMQGAVAAGKLVYNDSSNNCGGCHTFKPAGATGKVGPALDDLYKNAQLAGLSVPDFIRQSIVDPNAYVPPGYPKNVMPGNFGSLPKSQLDALIDYLVPTSTKTVSP